MLQWGFAAIDQPSSHGFTQVELVLVAKLDGVFSSVGFCFGPDSRRPYMVPKPY